MSCPPRIFSKRLLHALAGHVARDADVVGLAPDLVDLVDVDDADLGALHVVIRVLEQAQDDVLHVLADVTGLGQRGGVGDAKGHVEDLGQRAGQERFAEPVGPMSRMLLFSISTSAMWSSGREPD